MASTVNRSAYHSRLGSSARCQHCQTEACSAAGLATPEGAHCSKPQLPGEDKSGGVAAAPAQEAGTACFAPGSAPGTTAGNSAAAQEEAEQQEEAVPPNLPPRPPLASRQLPNLVTSWTRAREPALRIKSGMHHSYRLTRNPHPAFSPPDKVPPCSDGEHTANTFCPVNDFIPQNC